MTRIEPAALVERLNRTYERLHTRKEDAFWTALMGLADDADAAQRALDESEIELQRFLQDPERSRDVREALAHPDLPCAPEPVRIALAGWRTTFDCHVIESAEARALAEEIIAAEGRLARARGSMALGYEHPRRGFTPCSSVALGTLLRTEPEAAVRRAAWEGLARIEHHVLEHGFLELVRLRNRLGRLLGAEDYYDWKTRRVERMTAHEVFALLDELEQRTRERGRASIEALARSRGGLEPWDASYLIAGDTTREQDPYFPFADAVLRWGRSFAALGIEYRGADLVLDLLDRPGKYENGFMHGPVVAWRDGATHRPARIHFTANAIPGMPGSGQRAMETLFHEGGHAAHFAHADMPAPCFGQEFAPTSVAFSETQSMLLDSLLQDADWRGRYARDAAGRAMPLELHERGLRKVQPYAAWSARGMLAVCYGERALYRIPDEELGTERALADLRDVERRLLFLDRGAPRPVLAVPHLLAGDSSAYYHGYVMAEMAVHQTREHFVARDGHLTDNPRLGPELAETWWRKGNSRTFAEFVADLTGAPAGADALAKRLVRSADEAVADAREAVARLQDVPERAGPVRLDAHIRIDHGRERVAELAPDAAGDAGDFDAFAEAFATWIEARASEPAQNTP